MYISTQVVFAFYYLMTRISNIHDIRYGSLDSLYFTVIYAWNKRNKTPHTYRKYSPETQQYRDNKTRKKLF